MSVLGIFPLKVVFEYRCLHKDLSFKNWSFRWVRFSLFQHTSQVHIDSCESYTFHGLLAFSTRGPVRICMLRAVVLSQEWFYMKSFLLLKLLLPYG